MALSNGQVERMFSQPKTDKRSSFSNSCQGNSLILTSDTTIPFNPVDTNIYGSDLISDNLTSPSNESLENER